MTWGNKVIMADNEGIFDNIYQFPDIAGPGVSGQHVHRLFGHAKDQLLRAQANGSYKMVDEKRYVVPSLSKWKTAMGITLSR